MITFSFKKMIEKVVKKGIQFILAWIASLGIAKYGLMIDIDPIKVTALVFLGLEALRNFLKIKYPKVFSWL